MINPINVNMNADKIVHLINDCMNINVDVQLIVHINVNVNFYINIHIIYMTLYIWVKILLHSNVPESAILSASCKFFQKLNHFFHLVLVKYTH